MVSKTFIKYPFGKDLIWCYLVLSLDLQVVVCHLKVPLLMTLSDRKNCLKETLLASETKLLEDVSLPESHRKDKPATVCSHSIAALAH